MALIIGTTGDDAQLIDLIIQPDTIYGDQQGVLTGVGGGFSVVTSTTP